MNTPSNPFQKSAPMNTPGSMVSPRLSPHQNSSRSQNVVLQPQPVSYTSAIMTTIPLDVQDEWDKSLHQNFSILCEDIQLMSIRKEENIIISRIQEKNYPPNSRVPTFGLFYASLTSEDPSQLMIYTKIFNHLVNDFKGITEELKKFVETKFSKLQEPAAEKLGMFLAESIKFSDQFEAPFIALIKNMKTCDFSKKNMVLVEQILDICFQNKEWIYSNPKVLVRVLYSFLRMIEDIKILNMDRQGLEILMKKQLQLVEDIIRDNISKDAIQSMGRDLVRVLYNIVKKYKISETLEKLIFQQEVVYFQKILGTPSSSRILDSRINHDMFTQISFLISNVKMGNQRRYQTWFAQKFFTTPESEAVIPDLIRYINCVYHPPHEANPRWAILGWLFKSIKNPQILENAKLCIVYDMLFTISSEINEDLLRNSILPVVFLMTNSIGKYTDVTNALLDFIFNFVERQEPYLNVSRQHVINSLQTCTQKLMDVGNNAINVVYEKIDNERKEKVKRYLLPQKDASHVQTSSVPPISVTPLTIPDAASANSSTNKSPTLSPSKGPTSISPKGNVVPPSIPSPTAGPTSTFNAGESKTSSLAVSVKSPNRTLATSTTKSPTSPSRPLPFSAPSSKDSEMKNIRDTIEEYLKNALNKSKALDQFEHALTSLATQVSDYFELLHTATSDSKEVEDSRNLCKQTISDLIDAFSNATLAQPSDSNSFASFLIKILSFEFQPQVSSSQTLASQTNQHASLIVQTVMKERAEEEKQHLEKTLLRNQTTLLYHLLDKVCAQVLPTLTGGQSREASADRTKKLKKEKFSQFIKFACKTDVSIGYRILCFYVTKIYSEKIQELELVKPLSTDALLNLLIYSQNYKYKNAYFTFYEWSLGARKQTSAQDSSGGQSIEQVFLKDMVSCLDENHLLFTTLLPLISRDFSHLIQKNKEEMFKLIITRLYPHELQLVNTLVQNGRLKILFSQGKQKKPMPGATSTTTPASQGITNLDYITQAIVMIQNLNDHFSDDYEYQMFWTLLTNEICYNHTLYCMNNCQSEEDQDAKKSNTELYYKFNITNFITSILNTLPQQEIYFDILLNLVQRVTSMNPDGEALFSYEFIQNIITLPFEKFSTFPSMLLHNYLQCQYMKNDGFLLETTEKHFITILQELCLDKPDSTKKISVEQSQNVLMHFYYMKLLTNHSLQQTATKEPPNNNHYLLFECENFLKQIRKMKANLPPNNPKLKFIFTQLIGDFEQVGGDEGPSEFVMDDAEESKVNNAKTEDEETKAEEEEEEEEEQTEKKPPRLQRAKPRKFTKRKKDQQEEEEEEEEQENQESSDEEQSKSSSSKTKKRKQAKEEEPEEEVQENDDEMIDEEEEDDEAKALNNIKSSAKQRSGRNSRRRFNRR
ncbi:hypothetical protein FDP41_001361 [Naegleria fowleri]|uniref:Integrator complex subunit 3 N-terminal domain-containing protein n=1 Tax=Naegleria fowleri TaxID=5763 RepID=A0A6A5BNV5_NAEFO|nr:uncharacterized protein FDP41_001361 [Naegleria fowleri]KAF0979693.1 hypothetical protein FDP41_001361 [Naegleria fowleri]